MLLPEIKKCADNGDVRRLRYIFDDCLDVDPTFEKYKDGWDYCQRVSGLIEVHMDLTPFESNPSRWNDDYWIRLKSDLMKNFSRERFEHMINVAKVYYADKIKRLEDERARVNRNSSFKQPNSNVTISNNDSVKKRGAESEAHLLEIQRQREHDNTERYAKQQRERDAQYEAESKRREEERKIKEQEEATKKIVGVAVATIAIIVVVAILLSK